MGEKEWLEDGHRALERVRYAVAKEGTEGHRWRWAKRQRDCGHNTEGSSERDGLASLRKATASSTGNEMSEGLLCLEVRNSGWKLRGERVPRVRREPRAAAEGANESRADAGRARGPRRERGGGALFDRRRAQNVEGWPAAVQAAAVSGSAWEERPCHRVARRRPSSTAGRVGSSDARLCSRLHAAV